MSISVQIKKKMDNFSLEAGFSSECRRIGILGASGSGKSMTLKSIAGIVHPDSGQILLNSRVLYDSARRINVRPQDRHVGYLFQNYALFPAMTVAENISCGLKGSKAENEVRVSEMLERFRLTSLRDRLPSQLSGGQQQRTALARIMAYRPEVILLDEPFSALDSFLRDQMETELTGQLRDYDGTVIMVSHSRDEIYRFSEEILIVDRGRIVNQGETKQIFLHPGNRATAMLTGCKNFSDAVRIDDHTVLAPDWGVTLHTERVLPETIRCLGYRAHQFVPVWGAREENSIPFRLLETAELPFERSYYIQAGAEDRQEGRITWVVQKKFWQELAEKGMPDYLRFAEDDIMFLQ